MVGVTRVFLGLLLLLSAVIKAEDVLSISFSNPTLDLGDMSSASTIAFTVDASTDYTLSAPATGVMTHTTNGATVGYCVTVSKINSTLTVTPNAFNSQLQSAGDYSSSIVLTIAAI